MKHYYIVYKTLDEHGNKIIHREYFDRYEKAIARRLDLLKKHIPCTIEEDIRNLDQLLNDFMERMKENETVQNLV